MVIKKIPIPFNATIYFILFLFIVEENLPFESNAGSSFESKFITFIFYFLLALFGNYILPKRLTSLNFNLPSIRTLNFIRLSVLLGPIFLIIDRAFSRGLDFSLGITSLRQTMEKSSDGGISSFFSVFGYLGSALCFLLLTRLIIFNNYQSNKYNFLDSFFCVLIAFSLGFISICFEADGFLRPDSIK